MLLLIHNLESKYNYKHYIFKVVKFSKEIKSAD